MLKLDCPLVSLDLETTGVSTEKDRIVQIGMIKLHPDGEREELESLVNPMMPIPQGATDIHGITTEMVKDEPIFASLAPSISLFLRGCNLTGHNIEGFDLPLLEAEFRRTPVSFYEDDFKVIDTLKIFRQHIPHTLEGAWDFYCPERTHEHIPHNALSDARVTLDILERQYLDIADILGGYGEDHLGELIAFSQPEDWLTKCGKIRKRKDGTPYFGFGKNFGVDLIVCDPGYLRWIVGADFPADVKGYCKTILGRGGRI